MMKKQNTASAKSKRFITNTIVHVILAVLAVIWVIPIAWIIMISFRGESGQYISTLIPKTFTLNNYKKLFTDTQILNFPQMFINTLIISIFSCVISTFFVLSVSYCMSRMRFKMRKPMMNIALVLVSGLYVNDRCLLYFKVSWSVRGCDDSCSISACIFWRCGLRLLYCKRLF